MELVYIRILDSINRNANFKKYFTLFCNTIPYVTAIIYVFLLLYLLITHDNRLIVVIIKPFSVFLFVTIIRKIFNRPRPYDTLKINPLFKHKQGESFPSRHTASAFIIAFSCLMINYPLGIFTLIIASIIGITRVIAGVHYPSDVLVAIIIAYLTYLI